MTPALPNADLKPSEKLHHWFHCSPYFNIHLYPISVLLKIYFSPKWLHEAKTKLHFFLIMQVPYVWFFYSSFKWVALFYCFLKSSYIIAILLVSDFNRFFIVHSLTVLKYLYTWQLQPSLNIYRNKIIYYLKIKYLKNVL